MHYVAKVIREKYTDALDFLLEMKYLEKAATGNLSELGYKELRYKL